MPPASALRGIALIGSTPSNAVPSPLLATSAAGSGLSTTPAGAVATPIPTLIEQPTTAAQQPVVLASSTPPIPAKVAERIWKGEYVAVAELLPEKLTEPPERDAKREDKKKAASPQIQSIATWALGFSVYVGVMAVKHPERVPDLAAYMAQIIQASRQFKGTPWREYDTRFRLQAAASKHQHLATVDTSLWAITFANAEPREECEGCHSLDHETAECTVESKGKEPAPKKRKTSEEEEAKGFCFDFQSGQCRRGAKCRFRHACEWCDARHPGYHCTNPRSRTGKSRTPSSRQGRGRYY